MSMGNELNLIADKLYYQSLLKLDQHEVLSLKQLSDKIFSASKTATIDEYRFIQGEIYFLFGDYEASIYKWAKVEGRLKRGPRRIPAMP